MRTIKDDSVTVSYGYYRCAKCGSRFYGGGRAIHFKPECKNSGYEHCIYYVGPKSDEYDSAEEPEQRVEFIAGVAKRVEEDNK